MKKIRIGSGAGYAGDRLEPALDLMQNANLDYICFECLAERTIAMAQQEKMHQPDLGYNAMFTYRMERVLPLAMEKGVKVLRATRCSEGRILEGASDALPAAPGLNSAKARIALMLALMQSS